METTAEERASAAYKIFHSQIEVFIPQYAAVNATEEKMYGTPKLRDKQYEMELANKLVHTTRTIAEQAELHSKGVDIILRKPEKGVFIYSQIVRHIADMTAWINREVDFAHPEYVNRMMIVLDDLEVLQAYGEKVKPKAISHLPKVANVSVMRDRMARFSVMHRSGTVDPISFSHKLEVGDLQPIDQMLTSSAFMQLRSVDEE